MKQMKRLIAGALLLLGTYCIAQEFRGNSGLVILPPDHEFHFARLAYPDNGYSRWGRGQGRGAQPWLTDWPEAESFFMEGVQRLTRVQASGEGRIISLQDEELFDYPFLYAVEVGYWNLSDADAAILREYLLRGGFLMVDDFHGAAEWADFTSSLQRVFPDRPVVELADTHEVLHVLYDLDQRIQIPGIWALMSGTTYEQDGVKPHWRGVYDDAGNLLVAINFNMDLGDAWEHSDWPEYPEPMTALAYRFGINYIIYAMTH